MIYYINIHPVAAIAVLASILLLFSPPLFYSVEGKGNTTGLGAITNSTTKFPGGITFETIHFFKFDMHPCPDAPDLYCIGPHMINETIVKYKQNNLTLGVVPPVLPPLPP